ncbi:unnamed protein product [Peronospora belbahrii]|uniref:RxLR effector protein n=1 Tax=Peronospora belbahrii TaxID=622444 RepID=A0AAU9KTW4_9STRA|nr:unnamed protein product [Peronospora belbahrii]CAH0519011.1 unnamed protein product [Peronospora belbahrii]
MRFIFFLSLLLTTFVLSSDTFVSAETNAVKNYSYDRTNVRRRRGESNVEEERIDTHGAEGAVEHLLPAAMAEVVTPNAGAAANAAKQAQAGKENETLVYQKIMEILEQNKRTSKTRKKWSALKTFLIIALAGAAAGTASYELFQFLSAPFDNVASSPSLVDTSASGSA